MNRHIRPTLSGLSVLLITGLSVLVACSEEDQQPAEPERRIVSVDVTPSSVELSAIDATQDFDATARDGSGQPISGVSFNWSVEPESVASVDGRGTLTATANGSGTVEAEAEGTSGSATVTVDQEVEELDVTPDSARFDAPGDTLQFTGAVRDSKGNDILDTRTSWMSTDSAVASVDSTGLATAHAEGEARIIGEVKQLSDSSKIRVGRDESAPTLPASVDQTLVSRFYAASAWDPVRERMLIHGGTDRRTHGELWSYDPSEGSWSRLSDGPARWGHQAVWDSAKDRLLVFGGNDGTRGFSMTNHVWSYRVAEDTWSRLNPSGTPPDPREQAAVAFAPERREMFVFGGVIGSKTDVVNDLWVYRTGSNQWEKLQPSGSAPAPRKSHSMIWDEREQRLLVYGGWNSIDPWFEELWEYDAEENRWREISTRGEPPGRSRHGVAWNADDRHMLIYAGCCGPHGKKGDLWRYDVESRKWSELDPGHPQPSGRNRLNDQMVWDPVHEAMIVFAGRGECPLLNDLWAYVPRQNRWVELSEGGSNDPIRRTDHRSTTLNGSVYSFGGCDGTRQTADLVRFDVESGASKILEPTGPRPPARSKHALAAAHTKDRLYMYGGTGTERAVLGTVWSYDVQANEWSKHLSSGSTPASRFDHVWVWDPQNERLLLFGGVDPGRTIPNRGKSSRFLNDLWSYDPNEDSWMKLRENRSGEGPAPRKHAMGVWDNETGRLLIYGGHAQQDDGAKLNYTDLWAYDPDSDTWTLIDEGDSGPVHRVDTGAAWHPQSGQFLLYGGVRFSGPQSERLLGDLWSYQSVADAWSERSSQGPERRQHHQLVRVADRLILIGGYGSSRGKYLGTVWSYTPSSDSWIQIR